VGVHSKLTAVGGIAPSPLSDAEKARGMKPYAKTVINAFLATLGPKGTLFMPTHSNNTARGAVIDRGYYDPEKSPSNVGSLTQSMLCDDRAVRSLHPTHSIAAIGPEAGYLVEGHTPFTQPVGIENAFAKAVGLDGIILFIGDVIKANTMFHAYETLLLPALAPYFPGAGAVEWEGKKRIIPFTWSPSHHREFYNQLQYETKAVKAMRQAGLLKTGKLGNAEICFYDAKEAARFFAEKVFPVEPDVLFCSGPETCNENRECAGRIAVMKRLYAGPDGTWDSRKIKNGMSKAFLSFLKPGIIR
jgi:aminoglycoside 3-N-acetyltransferase